MLPDPALPSRSGVRGTPCAIRGSMKSRATSAPGRSRAAQADAESCVPRRTRPALSRGPRRLRAGADCCNDRNAEAPRGSTDARLRIGTFFALGGWVDVGALTQPVVPIIPSPPLIAPHHPASVAPAATTERLLHRALAGHKEQPNHGSRRPARASWFVKEALFCSLRRGWPVNPTRPVADASSGSSRTSALSASATPSVSSAHVVNSRPSTP